MYIILSVLIRILCSHTLLTCYREQTKAQLEEVFNEKETLESRIRLLESDIEEAKSSHNKERTSLLSQLEQAESNAAVARRDHSSALKQATALKQAKEKGDNICDELKKEAEYIMTDLEEANSKLVEAEQERDKVTHQKDKVMNELAKRNRDIEQKEEMIMELRKQLDTSKEKIAILDIQVGDNTIYHHSSWWVVLRHSCHNSIDFNSHLTYTVCSMYFSCRRIILTLKQREDHEKTWLPE